MKESLHLFQKYCRKSDAYDCGFAMICYYSVWEVLESPTDNEYETLFKVCYEAYLKAEECNWTRLCDGVVEKYANKEVSLEQLKKMNPRDILEMEKTTYA